MCFRTSAAVDMIIDINATTDVGHLARSPTGAPTPGRRVTVRHTQPRAGGVVRVAVPEAVGGKTVIGQLTVDRASSTGYVTAYGCDDLATQPTVTTTRSDLNFDGRVTPGRVEPADRPGRRRR